MEFTPDPAHALCNEGSDEQGNERVAVTLFADEPSPEHFILSAACQPEYSAFFMAAAPECNQTFPWCSLEPEIESAPATALRPLIEASFNEGGKPLKAHHHNGVASLPARWSWLALSGVTLKVVARGESGRLPPKHFASLLGMDTWVSAYFLNFGNDDRARLCALLDNLRHWQFAFDDLRPGQMPG